MPSLSSEAPPAAARRRLRAEVRGAVQGVGFRPFVYRLARELGLAGWVGNDGRGVTLEVEGDAGGVERFLARLAVEAPPPAAVEAVEPLWLAPAGLAEFSIRDSEAGGARSAAVLPDVATCADCRAELADPAERRHRYPFTNCTRCGPRFTIVLDLPYDRPRTTLRGFPLCPDCRREYEDPADRRFHAQPVACPRCGPKLSLLDGAGRPLGAGDEALAAAASALIAGEIVAVQGLGGFHLMADAADGAAVARLRAGKLRQAKPFALMAPDLATAARLVELTPAHADLLASPEAPIVLLPRRSAAPVAAEVAPGNPYLGVMLPATPLHHLLLAAVGRTVVATSGNLSDEPIAIDPAEALARLAGVAGRFLVHDRPIARPVDDSVAAPVAGGVTLLRRARGYAPRPLPLPAGAAGRCLLALGAHQKVTVALAVGGRAVVSQHLGDLDTPEAQALFERTVADLLHLYEAVPEAVVHDLHPDYPTTRWAEQACSREAPGEELAAPPAALARLAGLPRRAVQHHHAHLAAALAEAGGPAAAEPALGLAWDGTGWGPDGTVWGGEALVGDLARSSRVARLRPFRLLGGEAAIREPRRAALALLWQTFGEGVLGARDLAPAAALEPVERRLFARMLAGGLRSPWTSSAGRLFDGVAALLGLAQRVSFEGEAAMAVEFAATGADLAVAGAYPLPLVAAEPGAPGLAPPWELDWRPLVAALVADLRRGEPAGVAAARFHAALVEGAATLARTVGAARVALTGGCFQNRLLAGAVAGRLRREGLEVLVPRQVPPNDGGIAYGQLAAALAGGGVALSD